MKAKLTRPIKIEQPGIGCTQFEVVNNEEYCGKIFIQKKGTKTPAHSHRNKHETFLVWQGTLKMILDGEEMMMESGSVLSVERGSVHEFHAVDSDVVMFEFSTSSSPQDSYFEEKSDWERVNERSPKTREYEWPF